LFNQLIPAAGHTSLLTVSLKRSHSLCLQCKSADATSEWSASRRASVRFRTDMPQVSRQLVTHTADVVHKYMHADSSKLRDIMLALETVTLHATANPSCLFHTLIPLLFYYRDK